MYEDLCKSINYEFKNIEGLNQAFTHSSYSNENKIDVFLNNERLEFLGDAVLELTISDYLFNTYPYMLEGELTKLRASVVCEGTLSKNAKILKLGDFLILGKGEEQTGGRERESILADVFESLIGAIYLDGGIQPAKKFIIDMLADDVKNFENSFKIIDYKTTLQEYYQSKSKVALKYTVIDEIGPAHERVFTSRLTHGDHILGVGKGKSKKEAEQNAAYNGMVKNNLQGLS